MSNPKVSLSGRYGLLMWCTGLTIVYQLIVHVFMLRALPEEIEESDEECILNPAGPGAGISQSPRCQEVQMFHEWQMEAPMRKNGTDLDAEFMVQRRGAEEALMKLAFTSSIDSTSPNPQAAKQDILRMVLSETKEVASSQDEVATTKEEAAQETKSVATEDKEEDLPLLERIERAQQEMCDEPRHREYDFCKQLRAKLEAKAQQKQREETEAAKGTSADEGMPLMDRIEHAQQEMCEEAVHKSYPFCVDLQAKLAAKARKKVLEENLMKASSRAKVLETFVPETHVHASQLRVAMQQRVDELQHGLASISQQHDIWLHSFEREAVQALREMCSAPQRRDDPKCVELLHAAQHHNITRELQEHEATLRAQAKHNAEEHEAWEHKFEDEAIAYHRKLCEDPERRHRKDCEEFLAAHPAPAQKKTGGLREQSALLEANMRQLAANHSTWEHKFEEQIRQVHQKLCEDPRRRHRKDCEEFLAHHSSPGPISKGLRGSAAAQTSSSAEESQGLLRLAPPAQQGRGLRGRRPGQLRWQTVAESLTRRSGLGAGRQVIQPADVRNSEWVGEPPKVACITAVPIGQATQSSMSGFVAKFREQSSNYEGAAQLVLVYHFQDEQAAELVHLHVDGLFVKGVAARGVGDFPSTADLRFGAWSAADDAQVIVHWDWEAAHSPERLSLQVRAMAYSGRPASLLQGGGWREHGIQEETIAGHRAFIWKHWYPRLGGRPQTPLEWGVEEGKLVLVDMS